MAGTSTYTVAWYRAGRTCSDLAGVLRHGLDYERARAVADRANRLTRRIQGDQPAERYEAYVCEGSPPEYLPR